jgi:hypothetical protein
MKRSELLLDIFDAVTDVLEPFFHVFSTSFYAFANRLDSVYG